MTAAGEPIVDLRATLARLAKVRPVFHSEADFQFALAWAAKEADERLEVRLETRPTPGESLDLLFSRPDLGEHLAVELKYLSRAWAGTIGTEAFALKDQGASDIRCYDVIKDIARVERFIDRRPGWSGCVIVLTNAGTYWRRAEHGRETNADAFRIHEGNVLAGVRDWGPRTGAGTRRTREKSHDLRGEYLLRWDDYSRIDPGVAGTLRSLVIDVAT